MTILVVLGFLAAVVLITGASVGVLMRRSGSPRRPGRRGAGARLGGEVARALPRAPQLAGRR